MKKIIYTILIFSIIAPSISLAALIGQPMGGTLLFDITPKNPGSLTDVTLKISSYDIDIKSSSIKWYLNNKIEKEGVGINSFSFRTGNEGKNNSIRVVAENNGKVIERTITINPASVDILFQADTYIPPSYKGKALPSPQSGVEIFATTNFITEKGIRIEGKDLVYEWTVNGKTVNNGKVPSKIKIIAPTLLYKNIVHVKVSTKDGSISAEKAINLASETTQLLFYQENSIEGTNYSKALDGLVKTNTKEIGLRVEPYFFSLPSSAEPELEFYWKLNDKNIYPSENSPKIMTLRNEATTTVESILSLNIRNIKHVFQEAWGSLSIESGLNI